MVPEVCAIGNVVTGKLAEVAPPGTVTVAGTVAMSVLPELNETNMPPAGAGLVNVT